MATFYPEDTIPRLLVERARRTPDAVAMRSKEFGIWQPMTWRTYADRVRHFALGLLELGLEPGEKVAMIGDNRAEWLIADLAAQSLGGAGVALFSESLPQEAAFIVEHSDATIVVAEDQEQVDKLVEVSGDLPRVRQVVYLEGRGMHGYDEHMLTPFDEVERLGRERETRNPGEYDEHLQRGTPDDLAVLLYTSGTTGQPKGAMITHRGLLAACVALFEAEPVDESFDRLVFLPLAWAGERYFSTGGHVVYGYKLNFAEEPDTLRLDLREIGPHHVLGAPRLWEDLLSSVEVRMQEASWIKRRLYRWALPVGQKRADRDLEGSGHSPLQRLQIRVAEALVFRPVRDHLGLLRAKRIYSGGAALGADVFRWYHALGVPLKQLYGQTECGIVTVHWDRVKPATMGRPVPKVEMRTSDEGEVLVRGETIFAGYYKNPDATAAIIVDGWLHTGDEGHFDDDGHLVVLDRMKHVSELSSGERFSPTLIENKIKFSPYLKEAVCFGNGRDFVVALVNIDAETVGKWAEDRRVPYTTYADLSQRPQVLELVQAEIERANKELPEPMRIHRFCVLHKEFDADDDEVTRTRKVRRNLVDERYAHIIGALFDGGEELAVESEVTYRDGRRGAMRTTLRFGTTDAAARTEVPA